MGSTSSNDGDITVALGDGDLWLLELDAMGGLIWQRTLGGSGIDHGTAVQPLDNGGCVVVGRSYSTDGDLTTNQGSSDGWVVLLDSNQNIVWQHTYGGSTTDGFVDVRTTNDGGYIICGSTQSSNGDVTSTQHGQADAWVLKLDANGVLQWQNTYGGSSNDGFSRIVQTSDGGYLAAGNVISVNGDVVGHHGSYDIWLVKLDAFGAIQWQRCLGGSNLELLYSLDVTMDGGYILAGETESNDGDVAGWHTGVICGIILADGWVVKVDANGAIVWQRCLGGSMHDEHMVACEGADGDIIVAGRINSSNGDVADEPEFIQDLWVLGLEPNGNMIQWQITMGGSGVEEPRAVAITDDGDAVVLGITTSNDGDVVGSHSALFFDFWAIRLDALNASVGEVGVLGPLFWPVPATDLLTIRTGAVGLIRFTDTTGRIALELNTPGTEQAVDVSGLARGLYLVSYTTQQGPGTDRVVIE